MMDRYPFEFDNFTVGGENTAVFDLSLNQRSRTAEEHSEVTRLTENIVARLDLLLDEKKNNSLRLIRMILGTLTPLLLEKQSLEIVSRFVAEHFPTLGNERVLDFYFHPEMIYRIQPVLQQLAAENGFAGRIFLHRDSGLLRCDCRISWQRGEVTADSGQKIRRLMQMLTGEENERI